MSSLVLSNIKMHVNITNTSAEKQLIQLPKSQVPSVLHPYHTPGMSLHVPTLISVAAL